MWHPFEALPAHRYGRVFIPSLILTLAAMGVLNLLGGPLKSDAAPQGIVSFELAGDVPSAQAILDSWDAGAQVHAGFNLGLDFLFLVLYSNTIGLACVWVARTMQSQHRSVASVGRLLAWAQWLAALLDAVENVALLVILLDAPTTPWPAIAWWCAVPKFAFVFMGLAYTILGLAMRRLASRRP